MQTRSDLQYGGKTLEAAAAFWHSWAPRPGHQKPAPQAHGAVELLSLVCRLPRLPVRLSESPAGSRIAEHLRANAAGWIPKHRIAQGVLDIPAELDAYLRGRSRQAVRTNCSHARRRGISVDLLGSADERRNGLVDNGGPEPSAADREWRDIWLRRVDDPGRVWLAATAGEHRAVIGLAVVTVDAEWAMIEVLVAREHSARWLLHTELLGRLVDHGVRHLFVAPGNTLSLEPHVRHLQRLLGYRVTNLVISREPARLERDRAAQTTVRET